LAIEYPAFKNGERGIVLPYESPSVRHIYNQFIISCHDRDELKSYLKQQQISSEIYYPLPLHLQECFTDLNYSVGDMPFSEDAANHTLALPIYPELDETSQVRIVDTIAKFYNE